MEILRHNNGGARGEQKENSGYLQKYSQRFSLVLMGVCIWGHYSRLGVEGTELKAHIQAAVVCLFQIARVENLTIHWAFGRI